MADAQWKRDCGCPPYLPVFALLLWLQVAVLRNAGDDVPVPPRLHRAYVVTEDALEKILQVLHQIVLVDVPVSVCARAGACARVKDGMVRCGGNAAARLPSSSAHFRASSNTESRKSS
jgi:hypothetical protein